MPLKNYCSEKFWFLSVNAERQEYSSCCTAEPSRIDISQLKKTSGGLFNTEFLQTERQQLLNDERPASCRICWDNEDNGDISRRLWYNSDQKTHTNLINDPSMINLTLGSSCNLTCSYCNKQYSTSWMLDIEKNGTYLENDRRFKIRPFDKVLLKLGPKAIQKTDHVKLIFDETASYKDVERVFISGGEPFLYNNLIDVVEKFDSRVSINIHSGLGLSHSRFKNILSRLSKERVQLVISAETIGPMYEFNRYNNSYKSFLEKLEIIEHFGFSFSFTSVISNLTVIGFSEFLKKFTKEKIVLLPCGDPRYLNASVLDPTSKKMVLDTDYGEFTKTIHQLVSAPVNEIERERCSAFVKEFARRRNLSLNIFPTTFIEWLNI